MSGVNIDPLTDGQLNREHLQEENINICSHFLYLGVSLSAVGGIDARQVSRGFAGERFPRPSRIQNPKYDRPSKKGRDCAISQQVTMDQRAWDRADVFSLRSALKPEGDLPAEPQASSGVHDLPGSREE